MSSPILNHDNALSILFQNESNFSLVKVQYYYPYWGSEQSSIHEVLASIDDHGFDGIEINLPDDQVVIEGLLQKKAAGLKIVGQQVIGNRKETPQEYLDRALAKLEVLKQVQPDMINSHTGKDHFDFEENCMIIGELENWSERNDIPILHEIHRGRFTFHPKWTLCYLEKFPDIKLVGDFSHWCVVSESLLEDQLDSLQSVIPNVHHVHARVGWSQSAQVNDPFAPEWNTTFNRFIGWWQDILNERKAKGGNLGITPEFGPYPYMPEAPYSRKPLGSQQDINIKMKSHLQEVLRL